MHSRAFICVKKRVTFTDLRENQGIARTEWITHLSTFGLRNHENQSLDVTPFNARCLSVLSRSLHSLRKTGRLAALTQISGGDRRVDCGECPPYLPIQTTESYYPQRIDAAPQQPSGGVGVGCAPSSRHCLVRQLRSQKTSGTVHASKERLCILRLQTHETRCG